MKIGIFGGTFNPPHNGHLAVVKSVQKSVGLDKVLFIPSFISPHKQEGEQSLSSHRLEMLKIALSGEKRYEILEYELRRQKTSYTIDTLQYLLKEYPAAKFFLIIGMDNYLTFHQWKNYQKILEQSTLVVMNRPGYPRQINHIVGTKNVMFVEVPNIDISSSIIRQMVKEGKPIREMVGEKVEEYIRRNNLYK